jgi:hypothetical protein
MFLGVLAPTPAASGGCIYKREDTDFGHTIKAYWMLSLIGRVIGDGALSGFARDNAAEILHRAFLPDTGSWATQPTCDPAPHDLDRTSTWWMAAELDQAALTLGLAAPRLLSYLPLTYRFWTWHMVDHAHGEVWDEVALPGLAPRLPKVHLWKNGFHTAEHALVGYIAASAARSAPVTLHFAFRGCKLPTVLRPYYFDGTLSSHAEAPMPDMPGFCRSQATFTAVH